MLPSYLEWKAPKTRVAGSGSLGFSYGVRWDGTNYDRRKRLSWRISFHWWLLAQLKREQGTQTKK